MNNSSLWQICGYTACDLFRHIYVENALIVLSKMLNQPMGNLQINEQKSPQQPLQTGLPIMSTGQHLMTSHQGPTTNLQPNPGQPPPVGQFGMTQPQYPRPGIPPQPGTLNGNYAYLVDVL